MKPQFRMNMFLFLIMVLVSMVTCLTGQTVVHPTVIKKPVGFAISGPLRNNPVVSYSDLEAREIPLNREINPVIQPPDQSRKLPDPGEQNQPGWLRGVEGILHNYPGQNTNSRPPDANGDVNGTYYFQTVNLTYAIYNKSDGSIVAGPSPLNSIFDPSLPGAEFNNGDPIVLWDEHAQRWFFAEFSIGTPPYYPENDYILLAVSTTDDPTGTWYSWSFDVDDMPDYPKFGIWQDGYYMATNNPNGEDVYVFERDAMIAGESDPTMVGFDNPNRPSTFDNFHCILPLDNDGPWAPTGTPGQFITIADDGQGNPADELWIYELHVDWASPSNSTFARTQTLSVNPFDGNFDGTWHNIPQPGTTQQLDGISTVLMHRAQYRNFNGTQKTVCNHTIAESEDEAAIRWYELENTGSGWYIAQQGTYNPDNVSRWMASIAMNDLGEIAMAYSVSDGSSTYPGIRYCGQTNSAPSGVMDVEETAIWEGSYSQTNSNRWGDYSNISIDPADGRTFWFTSEYIVNSTNTKGTRIAAFSFGMEITLDQQRQDGTRLSNTTIGRWNGSSFTDIIIPEPPDPLPTINTTVGATEVLRGLQDLVDNPKEKYRVWERNQIEQLDNVQNHRGFTIRPDDENFTSRLHPTYAGITLKNTFLSAPAGTDPSGDLIAFKDPWLIDSTDAAHGNNPLNRGMQAIFRTQESPFNPDYTTPHNGYVYKGVFLNQNPQFQQGKPVYSVRAVAEQVIPFHGQDITWYFQGWDGEQVLFQNPEQLETALVFQADGAVARANYKGHLVTGVNAPEANNSRQVLRDRLGNWHMVYEDNGNIYYTRSYDNGATWSAEKRLNAIIPGAVNSKPALGYSYELNLPVVVWNRQISSNHFPVFVYSLAGNNWSQEISAESLVVSRENSTPAITFVKYLKQITGPM